MTSTDVVYENHLKKAYIVKDVHRQLAITDTSCYQLNEETAWLIAGLPYSGEKELYYRSLSGLGLDEPQKIFNKLVSLGALREKGGRTWKNLLRMVLTPSIKLLSSQTQEKYFNYFISRPAASKVIIKILAVFSIVGLLWGTLLLFAGPQKIIPVQVSGQVNIFVGCLLLILGSLVHEFGHSFTAMSTGIGFRPIGFSVYLIYPIFYTNVSGIEKISLAKRMLIDCGGFIFQGAFLSFLILAGILTGNITYLSTVRWIMFIVFFNLNPLFKTDGYWLYNDMYAEFKMKRWAQKLHYIYLVAFVAFSVYFLWLISGRVGGVCRGLNILIHSPEYFFSGGYRIVLGAYFILIGVLGGLRRFQESHMEWLELLGKVDISHKIFRGEQR